MRLAAVLVALSSRLALAGTPVEDMALPEPGPPTVERHEVRGVGPSPRYFFNPPRPASHFGMRLALGGGADFSSRLTDAAGGTFHLDVQLATRVPRRELSRRGPDGRYWASALWTNTGYSYGYSPALGPSHYFALGFGVGAHGLASSPSLSSSWFKFRDERRSAVAVGWVPHILLGKVLDGFGIGMRNVLAVEVHRHTVAFNLTYDLVRAWEGPLIHDVYLTVGFDPLGFL